MSVALQIFRVLATCTSITMLLSPSPMIYKIYKSRDTGVMSIVPLATMLVNSHIWMMYGYLDKNIFPVFATFVVGEVLALSYIAVFYCLTTNRKKANLVLAVSALLMAIATTYVFLAGYGQTGQSRHGAATTAGIVAMITGTIMYSSPLEKVVQVFKHKSAAFIPIHFVCAGSTNNAVWVTYTLLAKKWLIFGPSLFALCVGLFQVVLYFFVFHPSTHPLKTDVGTEAATDDSGSDYKEIDTNMA